MQNQRYFRFKKTLMLLQKIIVEVLSVRAGVYTKQKLSDRG